MPFEMLLVSLIALAVPAGAMSAFVAGNADVGVAAMAVTAVSRIDKPANTDAY